MSDRTFCEANMDRREFLGVMAALPLLPAMELETTPLVFPQFTWEQPGCVFFDNLSTLDWSIEDGSVRYFDWMGKLLGEWKPGDLHYSEVCKLFVQFPLPRVHQKTADTCEASAAQY